jgi:hypothetical protein
MRAHLSKLVIFAGVMVAATVHGIAQARRRPAAARAASVATLTGSLGVLVLGAWPASGSAGWIPPAVRRSLRLSAGGDGPLRVFAR